MTVNHSALQQSPPMQRKHTAGCRQHRDGEGHLAQHSSMSNNLLHVPGIILGDPMQYT